MRRRGRVRALLKIWQHVEQREIGVAKRSWCRQKTSQTMYRREQRTRQHSLTRTYPVYAISGSEFTDRDDSFIDVTPIRRYRYRRTPPFTIEGSPESDFRSTSAGKLQFHGRFLDINGDCGKKTCWMIIVFRWSSRTVRSLQIRAKGTRSKATKRWTTDSINIEKEEDKIFG